MPFFEKLSGKSAPLAASVARNLQAVLNAKEGYSASVEVFGLGRYDGHYANRALVDTLIGEMLAKVREYEPRLKQPAIELVGRDRMLWVRFLLTGICDGASSTYVISFHSVFRHVRVSPG